MMTEPKSRNQLALNIDRYFDIVKKDLDDEVFLYAAAYRAKMVEIMKQLNNDKLLLEVIHVAYKQKCDLFEYNLLNLVNSWQSEDIDIPFSMYYSLKIEDFKNFTYEKYGEK